MITDATSDMRSLADSDRSTWTRFRFDQIAKNITDRVDNPAESGVDRYVGLEHLDPESLQIRRWAPPTDVEATKLRFQPGDIIFGKRRAYQRKLAVADFEGICSAHALVLRARPEAVLPDFLPFFMQSEIFFERALAISVGSLSPTINWRTLAAQTFSLPPLEEQRRMAGMLWAVEETLEANQQLKQAGETLFDRVLAMTMDLDDCPKRILGSVAEVQRGRFSHRPRNLPKFYNGPYPFVQTGDVAKSRGQLLHFDQTLSEEGREVSRSFPPQTLLMTIAAVIGRTAITAFETWCPDSIVGIVPSCELDVRFLEYWLRTTQPHLESSVATQTAQKNINLKVVRNLIVPVPSMEQQLAIVDNLTKIESVLNQQQAYIASVKALQSGIVESLLGSGVSPSQVKS